MANIKLLLDKIKTAVYGIDVRDAIHDAIKQTYLDAIDANNSSSEVADARGSYNSLNERLNNISEIVSSSENLTLQNENSIAPSLSLLNNKFYECLNKVQSISFSKSSISPNFHAVVSFETDILTESIVLAYEDIIFAGDNTPGGQLILKSNTLYLIDFRYLKSNKILGDVKCYSEGDEGGSVDVGEDSNTGTTISDFAGANDFINIAMSYFNVRDSYLTYGQTNILTNEGAKSWNEITITGADSPDGRYRKLDCSAFVNLAIRGISFNEVLLNQSAYANKNLDARTTVYTWAKKLPRTAAEMCRAMEEFGWNLPKSNWHTDEANSNWAGLKKGDIYFLGGATNGRYRGIYHVGIYIGSYTASDGTQKICILDCSSNEAISKHTDGKIKAVRVLQFSKIDRNDIVAVARIQG